MTIWKFPINVVTEQRVAMPSGAKLLTCQIQGGTPCLWALVDPKAEKESRTVLTFGTGHVADGPFGAYLGTYQLRDGMLVFHVFEGAS